MQSLEHLEAKWGLNLSELDKETGSVFFEKLLQQLSQDLSKTDPIWNDVGWIASELLRERVGEGYIDLYNSHIVQVENKFNRSKDSVIESLYSEKER